MAFDTSHLAAMAHADGQTWWQYKSTQETKAAVGASGYFNGAANMLRVNDPVFIIASDGWGWFVINTNIGGTVTIGDGS